MMGDEGIKNDQGKPRYDLLPGDALDEIVKIFTYGAEKYSRSIVIPFDDFANYIKGECTCEKIISALRVTQTVDMPQKDFASNATASNIQKQNEQHVTQIESGMSMGCVDHAMTSGSKNKIQNTKKGKMKIASDGPNYIKIKLEQNKKNTCVKEESKKEMQSLLKPDDLAHTDSPLKIKSEFLNRKEMYAQFAEKGRDTEDLIWITTTQLANSVGLYAEDVIKGLGFSGIMNLVSSRHWRTCAVAKMKYSLSNDGVVCHVTGDRNWEKGLAWGRCFGAAMRHLWAFWRGEDRDPESGHLHLAHAATNCLFLLAYYLRKKGDDDRV